MTQGLSFLGGEFGWREALLAGVLLLALYMLFELFRLRWLQRKRSPAQATAPREPELAEADPPASDGVDSAWQAASQEVSQTTLIRGLEYEIVHLRDEMDALRSEFAALRSELGQEISRLRNSQTVSPLYSDAMQMAAAGHDAEQIAERCGISRAEADLVVALVNTSER